jgi:hypothetical protein
LMINTAVTRIATVISLISAGLLKSSRLCSAIGLFMSAKYGNRRGQSTGQEIEKPMKAL